MYMADQDELDSLVYQIILKKEEAIRKLVTPTKAVKSRQKTMKMHVESEQLSQVNLEIRTGEQALQPMFN